MAADGIQESSSGKDDAEGENLIGNGSPKILVERTLFTQKTFDEAFEPGSRPSPTIKQRAKRKISKYSCSGRCCKDFLFTLFPFLEIMKNYKIREDLMGDIISGLTVGIMHIPQGMAYGMLTTLPPVYGLYMSFFPVLVYFFFGSSKHISIGTFAVACLMIGTTVQKGYDKWGGNPGSVLMDANSSSVENKTILLMKNISDTNNTDGITGMVEKEEEAMSPEELSVRLSVAMSLTFMVGIIQLFMGITRLGFVTVYLSDPLISGFTTGAACHVFTSQIKHVFGVTTPRYSGAFKLIYTYRDFFTNIPTTNPITLITAILCMVILYCVSRFINQNPKLKPKMFMPVPIELIVVVLGTLISYLAQLETKYKVKIVNDIPTGLPVPAPPFQHLGDVIADAFALAIVVFAVSISMAKILAKKNDYEVNANQELVAFGISNIVSSFFASASPSASLSRSLIQERGGGKTQVAGLVSCVLLLVVLLAIGPYFRTLPNCVLAAIIIVALRGMFLQILDLKKLWSMSLIDFAVWIVAFLATVLLDVDLGLLVAVIFGIITIVGRSQRPYVCLLGRIPDTDIYRDINVYQEAKEVEGVKIYRFEYSLFFVNIEHFRLNLYKLTLNPRTLKIAQKKKAKKLKKQQSLKENKADAAGSLELEIPDPNENHEEVKVNVISRPVQCPPDCDFHTIILDCSSWGFVDSMGVKVLTSVIAEYKAVGVRVFLANCKAGIREMFEKTQFYKSVDRHNVYISVHDAVQHSTYVEETTIEVVHTENDIDDSTPLTTDIDFNEKVEDEDHDGVNLRHADSEGLLTDNKS